MDSKHGIHLPLQLLLYVKFRETAYSSSSSSSSSSNGNSIAIVFISFNFFGILGFGFDTFLSPQKTAFRARWGSAWYVFLEKFQENKDK